MIKQTMFLNILELLSLFSPLCPLLFFISVSDCKSSTFWTQLRVTTGKNTNPSQIFIKHTNLNIHSFLLGKYRRDPFFMSRDNSMRNISSRKLFQWWVSVISELLPNLILIWLTLICWRKKWALHSPSKEVFVFSHSSLQFGHSLLYGQKHKEHMRAVFVWLFSSQ